mgnify:CR=1 FL=1
MMTLKHQSSHFWDALGPLTHPHMSDVRVAERRHT